MISCVAPPVEARPAATLGLHPALGALATAGAVVGTGGGVVVVVVVVVVDVDVVDVVVVDVDVVDVLLGVGGRRRAASAGAGWRGEAGVPGPDAA